MGTGDKVDVEEVGTYFITYSATDSAGNTNTNYEYNAPGKGTTCNAGVSHVRTVIVEDSLVPIITLRESLMEETHDRERLDHWCPRFRCCRCCPSGLRHPKGLRH